MTNEVAQPGPRQPFAHTYSRSGGSASIETYLKALGKKYGEDVQLSSSS